MILDSKRSLLVVLGSAISLIFLWLAFRQTDFAAIGDAFDNANFAYVPMIILSLSLFLWLKTVRWRALLSPLDRITTTSLFPVVVTSYASNILLPAQLGELVRVYIASKKYQLSAGPVLVTIVLERMFDFLTILLFVAVVVQLEPSVPEELVLAGYICGGIGLTMLLFVGLQIWRPAVTGRLFSLSIGWLPERMRLPLDRHFKLATDGLKSVSDVRLLGIISATSVLQWLLMGACAWFAIAALDISVPISAAFVVLVVIVVGMTIPNSPGFFGTIQLCFTIGLGAFGIEAGPAIAASLVYHVVVFVSVAIGGAYFVRQLGYSTSELIQQAEAGAISPPIRKTD